MLAGVIGSVHVLLESSSSVQDQREGSLLHLLLHLDRLHRPIYTERGRRSDGETVAASSRLDSVRATEAFGRS